MSLTTSNKSGNGRRLHCIPEWAEKRGLRQADVARSLGVDKSTVSKWFAGRLPSEGQLIELINLLRPENPRDLFIDPGEAWIVRLFQTRSESERQRLLTLLSAAFPQEVAE